MKLTLAALWVLSLCAAGAAITPTSLFGWTVLAALTLLPPIVMLRWWRDAPQSLSESIQEALR